MTECGFEEGNVWEEMRDGDKDGEGQTETETREGENDRSKCGS